MGKPDIHKVEQIALGLFDEMGFIVTEAVRVRLLYGDTLEILFRENTPLFRKLAGYCKDILNTYATRNHFSYRRMGGGRIYLVRKRRPHKGDADAGKAAKAPDIH